MMPNLPYGDGTARFYCGQAISLNGNMHVLGAYWSSSNKPHDAQYHYMFNGTEWEQVSEMPMVFSKSTAIALNGEIYVLGGTSGGSYFYKWDGESWTNLTNLPYGTEAVRAVVFNGEIHILGYGGTTIEDRMKKHYKWDGTNWVSVSTLPYLLSDGGVTVFNDEIHVIGGSKSPTSHYKWNGISWTSVSTPTFNITDAKALTIKDKIYVFCSSWYCLTWDGAAWTSPENVDDTITFANSCIISHNGDVNILGWFGDTYLNLWRRINATFYTKLLK